MVRQRSLGSEVAVRLLRAGDEMTDYVRETGTGMEATAATADHRCNYPWAAAPDIIRAHQKDAYFQFLLLTRLESVVRSLYGARTAHAWTGEARVFTELLYLGLTTGRGNRTLGEEYTDIVQVEDDTLRLPAITRRTGYIVSSVLLPYAITRLLPGFRRKLRAKLESTLRRQHRRRASSPSRSSRPPSKISHAQEYILQHLDTLTSPSPFYAASLAIFYFTGAYYTLSKRLSRLRYIFTRQLGPSDQRAGYEVLGILLVLQMLVQGLIHVQDTVSSVRTRNIPVNTAALASGSAIIDGGVEISTDAAPTIAAAPLLFEPPAGTDPAAQRERLAHITHTPPPSTSNSQQLQSGHRYDLADGRAMRWISGKQARKCTLCLEAMKDPSVTTCGHVFCWSCVTEWLREQPMCPLCRQAARAQHVLPLRG